MISQQKFNELQQRNESQLKELSRILEDHPHLKREPYPGVHDPEYTYSHELTRLVARRLAFKAVNGQNFGQLQ